MPKLRHDVRLHSGRSRSRQREHRRALRDSVHHSVPQPRQILPQHPVVRPEVVSPLRNAMRLIDGDQRQLPFGQHLHEPRHAQPLRRNKQELQAPFQIIHACLPRHAALEAGVNPRHVQAQRRQLRSLVFHQRNQRRNHQRRATARNRRQLVAERLSPPPSASPAADPAPPWPPRQTASLTRPKACKPKDRPQKARPAFRIERRSQKKIA